MIPSSSPFNRCPISLVPVILDILSTTHGSNTRVGAERDPSPKRDSIPSGDGYHEKTIELNGGTYDEMTVFYYNTFGSPFSCRDPHGGAEYNVAFVEEPVVIRGPSPDEPRRYTVRITLMKLPAIPHGNE